LLIVPVRIPAVSVGGDDNRMYKKRHAKSKERKSRGNWMDNQNGKQRHDKIDLLSSLDLPISK